MSNGGRICLRTLNISQDWGVKMIRSRPRRSCRPLRKGEVKRITFLHGSHAIGNVFYLKLFCIRANHNHISSQEGKRYRVSERGGERLPCRIVQRRAGMEV